MAKLNQVLAIHKGVKSESYAAISELHKIIQKGDLFNGFKKTYQSNSDDGDKLEPQAQKVQQVVAEILKRTKEEHFKLLQIEARRDWTNCVARADITLDGKVVLADVPATYLLFLEKQLSDLHDVVAKLPILDSGDDWKYDESTGTYRSDDVKTHRTKKVQKPIVLYDATDKHPAQTQLITEDVVEGYWTATKFSGAMKRPDKLELLDRVGKLRDAVKEARETANMTEEVVPPDIGAAIYNYLMPKEV